MTNTPETLYEFVEIIHDSFMKSPNYWPMTSEEQVRTLRAIFSHVSQVVNTDEYQYWLLQKRLKDIKIKEAI